jgi:N-acetylglucosaminyldiphosphoundecaprenol N-acetyl-beta-D-mannosaminyltransferase
MAECKLKTYDVLGVPIAVTNLTHASETIEKWSEDDIGRFVCIRDVAGLMAIIEDSTLSEIHNQAAMITPDGLPIALLGKLRGIPVQRTCGPDLIDVLCARSVDTGLSHYFYGGKEGVAKKLAENFERKYPGLKIVGYESPPFRGIDDQSDPEAVARIRASGADVVWIGLSSPKQDMWMLQHYKQLSQTLIGVGAAFDFHTGEVRRAPRWMQKTMLEWLFRLASEPRRLWRRYLLLAPRFVWKVLFGAVIPRRSQV